MEMLQPGDIACSYRLQYFSRLQEFQRVATVDLVALQVGDIQPVNNPDGLADVQAWSRLERDIGRKQNFVEAEELDTAFGSRIGAEQGGIGIEHSEVVDRTLLHRLEQRNVIF